MSIDARTQAVYTSVRRSGTQLDPYRSSDAPLLRTGPGRGGILDY